MIAAVRAIAAAFNRRESLHFDRGEEAESHARRGDGVASLLLLATLVGASGLRAAEADLDAAGSGACTFSLLAAGLGLHVLSPNRYLKVKDTRKYREGTKHLYIP